MTGNYLSANELRRIWKDEFLPSIRREIKTEIQALKSSIKALTERCDALEKSQDFISKKYDTVVAALQSANGQTIKLDNALISGHPGGVTPGNPRAFAQRCLQIPPPRNNIVQQKATIVHLSIPTPPPPRDTLVHSRLSRELEPQREIEKGSSNREFELSGVENKRS